MTTHPGITTIDMDELITELEKPRYEAARQAGNTNECRRLLEEEIDAGATTVYRANVLPTEVEDAVAAEVENLQGTKLDRFNAGIGRYFASGVMMDFRRPAMRGATPSIFGPGNPASTAVEALSKRGKRFIDNVSGSEGVAPVEAVREALWQIADSGQNVYVDPQTAADQAVRDAKINEGGDCLKRLRSKMVYGTPEGSPERAAFVDFRRQVYDHFRDAAGAVIPCDTSGMTDEERDATRKAARATRDLEKTDDARLAMIKQKAQDEGV